ncbi:MAG: hypothetical protein AAGA90_20500 [Actinomycetota bacterium]
MTFSNPGGWTDEVTLDDEVVWPEDVVYAFVVDPSLVGVDVDDQGCGMGWIPPVLIAFLAVVVAAIAWAARGGAR